MDGRELDLGILLLWHLYVGDIWRTAFYAKSSQVSNTDNIDTKQRHTYNVVLDSRFDEILNKFNNILNQTN